MRNCIKKSMFRYHKLHLNGTERAIQSLPQCSGRTSWTHFHVWRPQKQIPMEWRTLSPHPQETQKPTWNFNILKPDLHHTRTHIPHRSNYFVGHGGREREKERRVREVTSVTRSSSIWDGERVAVACDVCDVREWRVMWERAREVGVIRCDHVREKWVNYTFSLKVLRDSLAP